LLWGCYQKVLCKFVIQVHHCPKSDILPWYLADCLTLHRKSVTYATLIMFALFSLALLWYAVVIIITFIYISVIFCGYHFNINLKSSVGKTLVYCCYFDFIPCSNLNITVSRDRSHTLCYVIRCPKWPLLEYDLTILAWNRWPLAAFKMWPLKRVKLYCNIR
jgi:hypothetical protein